MDNKSAVMIVAALIIGLFMGFFINSFVNQSQLQQLHDDAANYQSQINNLTAIIAKWSSSSSGTSNPTPTSTPVPTGTPRPTSTINVQPPDLQVYNPNAGLDGIYYYVNFSVYNIGIVAANITNVYLNEISSNALTGLSSTTINGQSVPTGSSLVLLQPGATAVFVLEGAAGSATGTIWQDSMAISISVQTSDGHIFSAGSQAILP